jgi:hypothetical protein
MNRRSRKQPVKGCGLLTIPDFFDRLSAPNGALFLLKKSRRCGVFSRRNISQIVNHITEIARAGR